jgi:hypothetical protein
VKEMNGLDFIQKLIFEIKEIAARDYGFFLKGL